MLWCGAVAEGQSKTVALLNVGAHHASAAVVRFEKTPEVLHTIQAVIDTRDYPDDRYLFFATKKGQVKKTAFAEYDKSRREGFIAINLNEGGLSLQMEGGFTNNGSIITEAGTAFFEETGLTNGVAMAFGPGLTVESMRFLAAA